MSTHLLTAVTTTVRSILLVAIAAGVLVIGPAASPAAAVADVRATASSQARPIPAGFRETTARVNGITVNYVIGGSGPTLVLLHGYPQNSREWFKVMPELGRHYRVIAPDLRGAGKTSAPAGGYDKKTMAEDLHALLKHLGRAKDVRVVGHDIGSMVAFAYADRYRASVHKLVVSEAPQPDESVYGFSSLTPNGPGFWNFGFFTLENGLPERTIDGHEHRWVKGFIDWLTVNKGAIGRGAIASYAEPLRDDAHLRASFEWFRAFDEDLPRVQAVAKDKLTMPVLALGAEFSLGDLVANQMTQYATDVQSAVIPNSGHWIWEERPRATTSRLLGFLK